MGLFAGCRRPGVDRRPEGPIPNGAGTYLTLGFVKALVKDRLTMGLYAMLPLSGRKGQGLDVRGQSPSSPVLTSRGGSRGGRLGRAPRRGEHPFEDPFEGGQELVHQ